MLKNILIGLLGAVIVVAIGASVYTAFASPGTDVPAVLSSNTSNGNGNGQGGNGNGVGTGSGTGVSVLDLPASDLSAEEAAGLIYMREEEKLARDVYNALFTLWGQPTFQNVAASEQMHMDEIKLLLDRYELVDPALAPGQFTDPDLQSLYDQLVTQGSVSLAEALKVGAAIEEIDILDLQTRLAQTDNVDIQLVYNNLMNGSTNHLQAFTSVLTQQTGETYQPQYMTAELYQSLIANPNGNQGGNGNGNGRQGYGNGAQSTASSTLQIQAQANSTGATTVHGLVVAYDLTGLSITTDAGQPLYIQLGNSRYSQFIGFTPQIGEGLTVYGFTGDQGLFSAISVTFDATGQTYSFRDASGRPLWTGGNGNGYGGKH